MLGCLVYNTSKYMLDQYYTFMRTKIRADIKWLSLFSKASIVNQTNRPKYLLVIFEASTIIFLKVILQHGNMQIF